MTIHCGGKPSSSSDTSQGIAFCYRRQPFLRRCSCPRYITRLQQSSYYKALTSYQDLLRRSLRRSKYSSNPISNGSSRPKQPLTTSTTRCGIKGRTPRQRSELGPIQDTQAVPVGNIQGTPAEYLALAARDKLMTKRRTHFSRRANMVFKV